MAPSGGALRWRPTRTPGGARWHWHGLLCSKDASDSTSQRLADECDAVTVPVSSLCEGDTVGFEEDRQAIWELPAGSHVGVVETRDRAETL